MIKHLKCLRLLAVLTFLGSLNPSAWSQTNLYPLWVKGPDSNRVTVVFLAEGYRNTGFTVFRNQAQALVNQILSKPPFSEYQNHFNFYAIAVPSRESGSDLPVTGIFRDTFFNSAYQNYGQSQLLMVPPNEFDTNYARGQGKIDALIQTYVPEADVRVVLVNNDLFGAATVPGGLTVIASTDNAYPLTDTLLHELGHSLGKLGDEYETPFPEFQGAEEPNTTTQTNRNSIKWRAWINPTTPVPTPETAAFNNLLGLFEGAHYFAKGWYRPKLDCRMRTLTNSYCEICTEGMVLAFNRNLNVIEESVPLSKQQIHTNSDAVTYSLKLLQPAGHALSVQWFLNGIPVAGQTGSNFVFSPQNQGNGIYNIRAEVSDKTALVRTDLDRVLLRNASWTAEVKLPVPQEPIRISAEVTATEFSLQIPKINASRYFVDNSTNLLTWQAAFTNLNPNAPFVFTQPLRFLPWPQFFRIRVE